MILRRSCSWLGGLLLLSVGLGTSAMAGETARRISGVHEGNCYNPILSPDGTRIAYEVNFFERRVIDLYVYDLTTGKEQQVQPSKGGSAILTNFGVEGGGRQVTYELAWSPKSSRTFVFASSGGDENYELYLSSGGVLASDPAADGMAAWSKDGQFIAFTSSRSGEGDLYLIDVNHTENRPTPVTRYNDSTEWYPTWSPEGRRLLFVRHHARGGDNLYVINDIANPAASVVQLTDWPSIQTKPSWSPDGKKVAFFSNRSVKERYDLYVMDAVANSTPKLVMENVIPNERLGPAWTPDGKSLLVVKDDPERFNPVRMVSIDDSKQVKVIATGTQNNADLQLVVTPAGKQILTFTAQGRIGEGSKTFKRVFTYTLDAKDLTY